MGHPIALADNELLERVLRVEGGRIGGVSIARARTAAKGAAV
jgi:hypothetical protein